MVNGFPALNIFGIARWRRQGRCAFQNVPLRLRYSAILLNQDCATFRIYLKLNGQPHRHVGSMAFAALAIPDERSYISAFRDTALARGVPVAIALRQWCSCLDLLSEPVSARDARRLGALLITTMNRCPDIGFDSYDRFFPSQDTMPAGGFGNLIALSLQNGPRENGNSVFLDDDFQPYEDQWAYL
jgi:hypothetical protein